MQLSTFLKDNNMIKTFAYHKPSDEVKAKIREIREAYSGLYTLLFALEATRERSLAMTKLEESAMWAIKSVVANDPKSEVEE